MLTFLGDTALISDNLISKYKPQTPYIINLEYVTGSCKHSPVTNKINIYSKNNDFKKVFGVAPLAVNVANNHALDYGIDGLNETLESMEKSAVPTFGNKPYIWNNICFLSYTMFNGHFNNMNILHFDKTKVLGDISHAKKQGIKRIVINMHWGIENHPLHNKEQEEIGHWLIDNGADIVIGCHPHCIQPIEKYKDKYIVYSMGNCLFPNFSLPSHFDNNGVSHRTYRLKWQHWNRKSIAIIYDEEKNTISHIDELYQKNNTLICKALGVSVDKYLKVKNFSLSNFKYLFRKYFLFFLSNFLVNGKLFDIDAIAAERNKKDA